MRRYCIIFLGLMLLAACTKHHCIVEQDLSQGWTLTGDTLGITELPVTVPSVVQQNLYEAKRIPHPYLGIVENDLLWISDRPWTYSLHFDADKALLEQDVVELQFEGIDTYASVSLNGVKLFDADNQFRSWKFEVGSILRAQDNFLEVHFPRYDSIQQAQYSQHSPLLPERYAVSRKAPYQHGWDWAPKYKNVGLWKPVKLMAWSEARLENAYIVTESANAEQATMALHLDVACNTTGDRVVELHSEGRLVQAFPLPMKQGNQHKVFRFIIDNPQLWWPNDMGEQKLYDFDVCLKDNDKLLDDKHIRTGIKTVEMVQEPDEVGFSFYLKVNGVPMYAKGANYVPEEMIETWMKPENTFKLLRKAKDAHFNMLRVWGGGVYPSDDFFNGCDELGLLVWEDFMYAGTMYPYNEVFLENAKNEALEQVKRLASHPSLALWCGGNEISEGYYNWGWQQSLRWSDDDNWAIKKGYDRLFEEILPNVVNTFDGTRPYWPSSPSKGWGRRESLTQGDVHYWGVWWGEQPYEVYREKVGRFNSEYGYQSYPDMTTLKEMAQDEPLEKDSKLVAAHQKHPRGTRQIDDFIFKYYPYSVNFERYVYLSQLSQAYGMGIAIEAHRTAKPYNMGTLYWQLNDAWPVVSWSSIDYYGRPKALQYQLKTLYAPVLLSLDNESGEVIVTSDLLKGIQGELKVMVKDFYGQSLFEQKVKVEMPGNQNERFYVEGLSDSLAMVEPNQVYVKLELTENDALIAERFCYLVYPKDLQLPEADPTFTITNKGDALLIEVKSEVFAKDVQLKASPDAGMFSDNFFDLEPGVSKQIVFTPDRLDDLFEFSLICL